MRKVKKLLSFVLAVAMVCTVAPVSTTTAQASQITENATSKSMQYVAAMGSGWNLGNSMDSINTDTSQPDLGEKAWGNPKVTRKLLQAVKAKGYQSIRIPLTFYRRYDVNKKAKDGEYKYVIKKEYLNRAKEIIDMALEEGFYVVTNIHHDSWIWLKDWDGKTSSEEYRMFTDFWKQLADTFKDESDHLCLETINEYSPEASGKITEQDKVMTLSKAAYDIIRQSGGNNAERMIVLPSYADNHEEKNTSVLHDFIKALNDENVIATVHYYCEWVYSANLGRTGFDEDLFGNGDYTPRDAIDSMMTTLKKEFLDEGIGVIIGEYGLLGYDAGDNCLQTGEELKYYDYMNAKARQNHVCLMFWDNGSGINRTSKNYEWSKKRVGATLESTMKNRISYAKGLDTIYLKDETKKDITIPLTLNGNRFTGIKGLKKGKDYTYNSKKAVVTLKKSYVNNLIKKSVYGTIADLTFTFSEGSNWHEYLVYYGTPSFKSATGTKEQIDIPVDFNGSQIRRISAYQNEKKVGPNASWWNWLQNGSAFEVDYKKGILTLKSTLFSDESVTDGDMKLSVEFYDGRTVDVNLTIKGNVVSSQANLTIAPIVKVVKNYKGDRKKVIITPAGNLENITYTVKNRSGKDGCTLAFQSTNEDKIASVEYMSADKNVVTIAEDGAITFKHTGSTTIFAKVTWKNGTKKTVKVNINLKK